MKAHKTHGLIAHEGYPFITLSLALSVMGWFVHPVVFALFAFLALFNFYFFRNPPRSIPSQPNVLIAPADGKVIYVGPADENRFLKKKVQKISIFMSPLDVHVNRVPFEGQVKHVSYHKGEFLAAFAEKASLENEQNAVVMQNSKGDDVLFVQIAGWLARRIVCYAEAGDSLKAGEIFGLIRYGSRMDVYFPMDYEVKAKMDMRVKGGETILAQWN